MALYMEITTDKYELPLIVADSIKTLATESGYSVSYLSTYFYKVKNGLIKRPRFIKIQEG